MRNESCNHVIMVNDSPGTLTNQITPKYLEPRLLLVTDPRTDQQAIKEAISLSYI